MQIPVFTVDAFTNKPFCGNPAAVCLIEDELQDDICQKISSEMNLSETAFIKTLNSKDTFSSASHFGLRWFTPTREVPLCGHATLASAAVLFYIQKNSNSSLTFETLSGELYARLSGDHIVLDFPIHTATAQDPQEVKELIKTAVGDLAIQDVRYSNATKKLLVRLCDTYNRSVLESLKPDTESLMKSDSTGKVAGLIITLKGNQNGDYDFYSRYFSPWNGIPEDPVTGSAHTVLGSYWSEQLGKKEMLACQCSHRGGQLKIAVRGDGRVDMAGQTVTVLSGNLML
ncbi:phenazine biosynthesis-like domain-containing protein [Acipenser oxyrinchus oxyrinchus]|uniref:Phenazine biosynthesis-like domain-containing protein n=1 Tax=Acipenser oxyrinchus oxyrinchus TaxID=40147 RepID=A0AAD8D8W6_ACIOX|nr:phenazine biosynthesis-like domain-containing protein [Acipenser oxyrinchus oxyrinchus]